MLQAVIPMSLAASVLYLRKRYGMHPNKLNTYLSAMMKNSTL